MAGLVALTNADDGKTVPARTGDDIDVTLTSYHENGLTYTWSIPVSDSEMLHRTASRTTPGGGAKARFHVQQDGTATLSAARHCRPSQGHPSQGHPCPDVVTPWKVRVEVK
ncbi:hypothetical protein CTZ27_08745 [Streptomyces griseocarneus]|nr:hypothetical protein CTZ27_08745 [Streptomyces griseocarneus]